MQESDSLNEEQKIEQDILNKVEDWPIKLISELTPVVSLDTSAVKHNSANTGFIVSSSETDPFIEALFRVYDPTLYGDEKGTLYFSSEKSLYSVDSYPELTTPAQILGEVAPEIFEPV
jgi:hypothetical protein